MWFKEEDFQDPHERPTSETADISNFSNPLVMEISLRLSEGQRYFTPLGVELISTAEVLACLNAHGRVL